MKIFLAISALLLVAASPAKAAPISSIVVAADTCTLLRHGHSFRDAVNTAIKTNADTYISDYKAYGKALASFTTDQLMQQCPEQLKRVSKEVQS